MEIFQRKVFLLIKIAHYYFGVIHPNQYFLHFHMTGDRTHDPSALLLL